MCPKSGRQKRAGFLHLFWTHTGIDEATPAGKTMRQYFEHFGFNVVGEWYVPGEFHGREDLSTQGKLGDLRGKPTAEDLAKIKKNAQQLAERL